MLKGFWGFFTTGLPANVLNPSLLLTAFVIIIGFCFSGINKKKHFILWTLLVEYVFVVISSTVIFRDHYSIARWELMPFWTYKAVIDHVPGVKIWDIVLNVVMFMPLGFLVKMLYPRIGVGMILLIAIACSLSIEVLQNIYSKGISQFDDIMHNSIGAILGWLIAKCIIRIIMRRHN